MVKKYGLLLVNCIIVLAMIFIYAEYLEERSMEKWFPVLTYTEEKENIVGDWTYNRVEKLFPVLACEGREVIVAKREDSFPLNRIKPVELLTMMEIENGETTEGMAEEVYAKVPVADEVTEEIGENHWEEEIPPLPTLEPEVVQTAFIPRTLQNKVDLNILSDYETLVQNFYTIDACAMVGSNLLDADTLADIDLRVTHNATQPQILIYHTHSQEGFADSVVGDDSTTILGVGAHLAEILREEYGYQVLHHQGKYDEQTRDNAYSRALPDIAKILEENPSIEVVIDLHRDAVKEDYKLIMDLDGRPTARFMFFNGVSCTRNTGQISYLENEYQLENLAFSFQMKKAAEEYYPGLTRKNYIHGYRYNMHLLPRTALIELGAQTNTVEEVMNACDPIAHILDMVLSGT